MTNYARVRLVALVATIVATLGFASAQQVAPDTQEVTLTITVEAKDKDSTLFLAEVAQSGIFVIQGYTAEELQILIGSFCPNTLYPFAREVISDLVTKGGFPQLLLQPLNFDAIFAQAVQERAARGTAPASRTCWASKRAA